MKNTTSILVLIATALMALALQACKKEKDSLNGECGVEERTYQFFPTSHLSLQYYGVDSALVSSEIIKGTGDKLVFQYLRTVDESACCADCGDGDWVLFEVDKSLISFDFEAEDLEKSNLIGGIYFGFGGHFIMQPIHTGKVKGIKLSEQEWQVEMDIPLTEFRTVKLNKRFKL